MAHPQNREMAASPRLIHARGPLSRTAFVGENSVPDLRGQAIARLTQAPTIVVTHAVQALRRAKPLSHEFLDAALAEAGRLFRHGTLCGLTPERYAADLAATTGLPAHIGERSLAAIAEATARAGEIAALGLPRGASWHPVGRDAQSGCAQLHRRGAVLAVIAPGNGPGVHALWPQAVALGYRVAVRPSEREPFTAERLVAAMAEAGLAEHVAFLPCSHEAGEALVQAADLAIVYGGEVMLARHAGNPHVLVQGPGRSKIVIGADYPQRDALELVFESVTGLGGAACVSASAVLVEGDADRFARDLHAYTRRRFLDVSDRARWAARFGNGRVALARETSAMGDLIAPFESLDNGDGTHAVMPLIWRAAAGDPAISREWPFPAVTVAPFGDDDGLAALSPALVVTIASRNEALIARVGALPGIHNLYIGDVPTTWMRPDVPHDGYLSEFLVTTRGFRRQG